MVVFTGEPYSFKFLIQAIGGKHLSCHQTSQTATAMASVGTSCTRLSSFETGSSRSVSPMPMRRTRAAYSVDLQPGSIPPLGRNNRRNRRCSEPNLTHMQPPPVLTAPTSEIDLLRRVSTSPGFSAGQDAMCGLDFFEFRDLCETFFVQIRKDLWEIFSSLSRSAYPGNAYQPLKPCKDLAPQKHLWKPTLCSPRRRVLGFLRSS